MTNWKLKSCPRCGGDLFVSRDEYDTWFQSCLQCGYSAELKKVTGTGRTEPERVEAEDERVKAAR